MTKQQTGFPTQTSAFPPSGQSVQSRDFDNKVERQPRRADKQELRNSLEWEEMVKRGLNSVRENLESTDLRVALESRKALNEHIKWLQNKREEISGVIEGYQKLLDDADARHKTLSSEE